MSINPPRKSRQKREFLRSLVQRDEIGFLCLGIDSEITLRLSKRDWPEQKNPEGIVMSQNAYAHGLDRQEANFQPLTPLSFLERAAAVNSRLPEDVVVVAACKLNESNE